MKEYFKYKYDDLFNPVLQAMHSLGGSGSVDEIEQAVIKILKLSEKEISDIHRGVTSKLSYRLAWARNYLKRYGLLENSARKIWRLTEEGRKTKNVDQDKVKKHVKNDPEDISEDQIESQVESDEIKNFTWHDDIIREVLKISPAAFERLCQFMLRELGFIDVEVTGRTNDGGIDGRGILKLASVITFHVVFQAKRHKGSVSNSVVRNLRGAMSGRTADRGLIITSGVFTNEAKKEAAREGALPIELINGRDLAEKLKELKLGVKTEMVERVTVDKEWFKNV